MRVKVPSAVVQNSYKNFPEGAYDGNIAGAKVRDVNGDGSWVQIKLSLDNVTPREGTDDPGRDRFTSDITLVNTDRETGKVVDVRQLEEINGSTPWSIERGAGHLAGLAAGLDAAEVDDSGDVTVDFEALAEALVDGHFEGQRVGFTVSHYTNAKGDTYDQFDTFGPAS